MQHTQDFTDEFFSSAEWLDLHFRAKRAHHERTAGLLDIRSGERVLDLGCGSGAWAEFILEKIGADGELVCADPLPDNIAFARRALDQSAHANIGYAVAGTDALDEALGAFDVIHLGNVVGYFTNPVLTFRNLASRLRPNGRLIVRQYDEGGFLAEPVREDLLARVKSEVAQSAVGSTGLEPDMYAGRALRQWLLEAGFREVSRQALVCSFDVPFSETEQRYLMATFEWMRDCAAAVSTDDAECWRNEVMAALGAGKLQSVHELEFLYHAAF